MTTKTDEQKIIDQQRKDIDALKQAVNSLQRQLKKTLLETQRAKELSRRNQLELNQLKHYLKKGEA